MSEDKRQTERCKMYADVSRIFLRVVCAALVVVLFLFLILDHKSASVLSLAIGIIVFSPCVLVVPWLPFILVDAIMEDIRLEEERKRAK